MGRSSKAFLLSIIICVLILFIATGGLYYYKEVYLYKTDYINYVSEAANNYGVDIYLVFAVIKVESSFKAEAVSRAGAVGLMQLMPDTAAYLNGETLTFEELSEPNTNINLGVKYLSYLFDRFDDYEWVLVAYNAGETKAKEWRGAGIAPRDVPYRETRDYIVKINKAVERYRQLYYLY